MLRNGYTNKFNRGEVDPTALARDDVIPLQSSASLMENWLPLRLGAMMYRSGTEYINSVAGDTYLIPFIKATDDVAILEFTNQQFRIWVNDALVTRNTVGTSVTNGEFTSNLGSWTDADESGATSSWKTGGYMSLLGTGTTSAIRYQTIDPATDANVEHGLRIVVVDAPVRLQIGTGGVGTSNIADEILKPGTHSLAFTPGAIFTITLSNAKDYEALVDSVSIEASGILIIPTSVLTAALPTLRYGQSADILFCAYGSGRNFDIERRGVRSWSIVDYRADDGPFNKINDTDITLTPGALSGNTTLTASKNYFTSNDVGQLFKVASTGQTVTATVSAEDTGTNSIRVTGIGDARIFSITVRNLAGSTVNLQRSTDDVNWVDWETYTSDTVKIADDEQDNAIFYYRLWVKTGNWGSDSPELTLEWDGGSITGVCRVTSYTSTTVVNVQVLEDFGAVTASRDWYRGSWGETDGYPSAVALFEGRLWWAGKDKAWGSVSDAYYSIDTTLEGDSAAIQRTIGFGPSDQIGWLLPLNRLIMGLASDEVSIRSDSFGVRLTPSNANLRPGSSNGVAMLEAIRAGVRGYYVQRSKRKIYELTYSLDQDIHDSADLTLFNPAICASGIKRIAVTEEPEKRLIAVLDNGEVRIFLFDKSENVTAWSRWTTDGNVEDVVVLPGSGEDRIYFTINRTGGQYLEKMALLSEADGGSASKHFDSFVEYTSPGTTLLTGLGHLEGKTVHVWADGQYRESAVVASGTITVSSDAWTNVIVGLRFNANYRSNKLGKYGMGSVLTFDKRVAQIGLIMKDYWPGALQVGPDASNLEDLPDIEDGTSVDLTTTMTEYDEPPFEFPNGDVESDPRIYMRANGPCTVLALTYLLEHSDDPEPDKSDMLASLLGGGGDQNQTDRQG